MTTNPMTTNPMTANDLFKQLQALNRHFAEQLGGFPSFNGQGARAIGQLRDNIFNSCPIQLRCESYSALDEQFKSLFVKAALTRLHDGVKVYTLGQTIDRAISEFLSQAQELNLKLEFEVPGHPRSELKNPNLIIEALNQWCNEVAKQRQDLTLQLAKNTKIKMQTLPPSQTTPAPSQTKVAACLESVDVSRKTTPPENKPPLSEKIQKPKLKWEIHNGLGRGRRTTQNPDLTAARENLLQAYLMASKPGLEGESMRRKRKTKFIRQPDEKDKGSSR